MAAPTKAEQQAYYDAIIEEWPHMQSRFSAEQVTEEIINAYNEMLSGFADCTRLVSSLLSAWQSFGFYGIKRPDEWRSIFMKSAKSVKKWVKESKAIRNASVATCLSIKKGIARNKISEMLDYL